MIRLRQIRKSFQDKSGINEVLLGIDLDVMEGELVSIMGPSGAGKSLLLSILGMQGRQIMELFQKLNREGTTIIQVTHSEFNAAYGNRVLHILDGQIEEPAQSARGSDAD